MQATAPMVLTLILQLWLVKAALYHVLIAYQQQVAQLAKLVTYTIAIIVYPIVPLVCINHRPIVFLVWVCVLLAQALLFAHLARAII